MSRVASLLFLTIIWTPVVSLAETNLVKLGDIITFQSAELDNSAHLKTVKWSQSFRDREEVYLQLTTLKEGASPDFVIFFVQKALIPSLKKQCPQAECKLKVSKRYQYGQNKEKTLRFLILHNKINKPYQHRFMSTSTLATFAQGAERLTKEAQKLGVIVPGAGATANLGHKVVQGLKSVIGDPLRDF